MSPGKRASEYRCTHKNHALVKVDVVLGRTITYPPCKDIRHELGNIPCSYFKPTWFATIRDLIKL